MDWDPFDPTIGIVDRTGFGPNPDWDAVIGTVGPMDGTACC